MGAPSGLVVLSIAPSDPLALSEAAVLVERMVALVISPSEAEAVSWVPAETPQEATEQAQRAREEEKVEYGVQEEGVVRKGELEEGWLPGPVRQNREDDGWGSPVGEGRGVETSRRQCIGDR